ncbi:MAG: NUDIX domain-containing protein [Anaerolineae bacterium]|nr:NUDIX domain-containing protein [Anaerolineae bacterium]
MNQLARIVHRLFRLWWRLTKPITVGVRVLLIRDAEILLVKHTYQEAWYMPGGGVKRFETLEQAIRREAAEEVGAELDGLELFGVYSNFGEGKSDHVIVFLCTAFTLSGRSDHEIACSGFFSVHDLPAGISTGTRRRIQEYLDGDAPCFGIWRWGPKETDPVETKVRFDS